MNLVKKINIYNKCFLNINNLFLLNKFFLILVVFKNLLKLKNLIFLKFNNIYLSFLNNLNFTKIFLNLHIRIWKKLLFSFCAFTYYKIFLKVGLGFRKKYVYHLNYFMLSVGLRKWILFKPTPSSYFFNIRRRNIFIFVNKKQKLYYFITHLKYMRKEVVFKVKGIMTFIRIKFRKRIARSVLFARRVKFKKIKLKLTKKQKQRK